MSKFESFFWKITSRKFIMCLLWFILLFICIIKDGDMIKSGFAMVIAWTGAIVNCAYVLGSYLKDVANLKYKDLEITLREPKAKEKKNGLDSK